MSIFTSALARGKKWRGDCWWKGGTKSALPLNRGRNAREGVGVGGGVPLPHSAILKYE